MKIEDLKRAGKIGACWESDALKSQNQTGRGDEGG